MIGVKVWIFKGEVFEKKRSETGGLFAAK
jgi:ribosomal protein S3